MDAELLLTFIEVSKTRHFGRAAEKSLPDPVGGELSDPPARATTRVSLFARHRNNIRLTASGERLLLHATQTPSLYTLAAPGRTWPSPPVSVSSSP